MLFIQVNELNRVEIVGGEATQTKTLLDNGEMSPLLTQPPSQSPLPAYSLDAPLSPLPRSRKHASNTTRLARDRNLPSYCLAAANYILFGVCQDWVKQNPGKHLDGGIEEYGKWQKRR